jgi:RNA recognition motif-containing protein
LEASDIQGTGAGQLNGSAYDNIGNAVTAGFYIVTEGNVYNSALGENEFGPALLPVVKSNTYKGAPIILNVDAFQNDYNESKDVIIEYYLLLGQDRGQAYIEYWYRSDFSPSWEKLDPQYLNNESWATGEGLTSKSGRHENVWQAGVQLGNQVKTSNAQIRVTANYGVPSGWDGNGEFTATTDGGGTSEGGVFVLFDPADQYGVSYYDSANDTAFNSAIEKRDSILANAGLVSVGTYNDSVQNYPVYDFTGKETYRDQFAPGLTGHFLFSINDTNIVRVQLQTGSGPE